MNGCRHTPAFHLLLIFYTFPQVYSVLLAPWFYSFNPTHPRTADFPWVDSTKINKRTMWTIWNRSPRWVGEIKITWLHFHCKRAVKKKSIATQFNLIKFMWKQLAFHHFKRIQDIYILHTTFVQNCIFES